MPPDPDAPIAPVPSPNRLLKLPMGYRFALLNLSLIVYGFGLSAMLKADVGLVPWDVLHVGLTRHISWLTVGTASIGVGLTFQVIAWFLLKIKPGVGSVLNMILIGLTMDILMEFADNPIRKAL